MKEKLTYLQRNYLDHLDKPMRHKISMLGKLCK